MTSPSKSTDKLEILLEWISNTFGDRMADCSFFEINWSHHDEISAPGCVITFGGQKPEVIKISGGSTDVTSILNDPALKP